MAQCVNDEFELNTKGECFDSFLCRLGSLSGDLSDADKPACENTVSKMLLAKTPRSA
jgi:hypothetical protein